MSVKHLELMNKANETLAQARVRIVTRIAHACPTHSKEIASLVRQHIEIFALQRSLEDMDASQIALAIDKWTPHVLNQ